MTPAPWLVRPEGAEAATAVPSAAAVVDALRDGRLAPTDEVRGPADPAFVPIEAHPAFEHAAEELQDLPSEPAEETHLDMNPLIDVCLVLLIFFILTITYASLRYAVDIPDDRRQEKGAPTPKVDWKDLKQSVFLVTARMEGDRPAVKVGEAAVPADGPALQKAMAAEVAGGKNQMLLDVDGAVPWGLQTALFDAARGAKVQNVLYNLRR